MSSFRTPKQFFLHFILVAFVLCNLNTASGQSNPNFLSSPVVQATYGNSYLYDIDVSDDDGDELTVVLQSGNLPDGVTLLEAAGEFSLEGIPIEAGDFPITLEVRETTTPANNELQNFTLQVTKANLTVSADDQNIVYGDAIPALSISYSGFVNSEDQTDLTTVPTASTMADMNSDAGDYIISVSGGVSDNYAFNYSAGNLNIAKADQTITFDAIEDKTYGDADFTLSASSDSGLPISFSVLSGNASVIGNTVSING
ncbi:hypothetical protein SAMN05661096_03775, partial [Marivirga sericea]